MLYSRFVVAANRLDGGAYCCNLSATVMLQGQ